MHLERKYVMNTIKEILEPQNWEFTSPKDKLFSSDHVIEAYLKGKKEGLEQAQKLILEKLVENVNNSGNYTTEIHSHFNKKGFHPVSTFLKIISWDNFKLLITLPENEFISDKIIEIYDFISDYENRVNKELYHLEISLTDINESTFDKNCLRSDGFVLKHKLA